jgi:hypothetical protein
MGQQLATRGVTHQPEAVWRMNGTTTETGTRQSTPFEIWFEKGDASGLPVRIEFHPKSFLKLVFEQSGAPEGPKFSYLLSNRSVPPREASR